MSRNIFFALTISLLTSLTSIAQPPHSKQGPPPDRPHGPNGDWMRPHDSNKNGSLEFEELKVAADRTFAEVDSNGNGIIDVTELMQTRRPPQAPRFPNDGSLPPPPRPRGSEAPRPGDDGKRLLPPFFFNDRIGKDKSVSREDFDIVVRTVFTEMDKNGDGTLTPDEVNQLPRPERPERPDHQGPPPPNAQFIGAELRFGDKVVKGQPFSAEMVIEDTRLLFDGTTVKNSSTGAIYRAGNGRLRREQPLEMIGGVSISGSGNSPQKLIFVSDFVSMTQYFIDDNRKVARKTRIPESHPRPSEIENRPGSKSESNGTRVIEGVSCNITRIEHEIPAGQIGNEKALRVFSETCFSPELQLVIMSLHQDPLAGLHVFTLRNIKRTEPAADLFAVPAGYRIEN